MPLSSALISTRAIYPDRSQIPIQITHASGISVFDTDQREYLDAALGSGSIILGHGDEEIIGILTEQARRLTIHPGAGFAYELVDRYAERLIGFAPSGYDRVCLATSGSDAVEMAIKLALQYHYHRGETLRTKIIGREASYHGNTLAGLSAGHFLSRRAPYEATFPPNARGACALCTKCQFHQSPASCALECATSLATAIEQEGPESVAAVILEPVVGAALSGAVPDPRYLGRVREICDHYGVLFIVDEVMTGFGRTGEPFAVGHWDITPDVIICGKAMSAGYYPLSGILISTKLSDVVEAAGLPLQHGQTHSGNPVGAAVGLAVIDRIEQGNLLQNAASMGAILRDALAEQLAGLWPTEIRGLGLMTGVELCPRDGVLPPGLAGTLQRIARDCQLLIYPSQGSPGSKAGEHFLLLPAININEEQVARIVTNLKKAFQQIC